MTKWRKISLDALQSRICSLLSEAGEEEPLTLANMSAASIPEFCSAVRRLIDLRLVTGCLREVIGGKTIFREVDETRSAEFLAQFETGRGQQVVAQWSKLLDGFMLTKRGRESLQR
jgi:hypothetical protein